MKECELLGNCGFFQKYQSSRDLACKGFLSEYCRGPKMDQCKRKQYRKENGRAPADEMLPNGATLKG